MGIFNKAQQIAPQAHADAMYGAACREVWLRYNPEACTTQEERAKLAVITRDIMQWAESQPNEIKLAYQKACATISSEGDKHLENANRARYMMELHRTLPKPPQ
jgi:hypothetical protein